MALFKKTMIGMCLFALMAGSTYASDLPVESTPSVETLPKKYPKNWVFSQDINFAGLEAGKIVVLDVASSNRHYKGMMNSSIFGSFAQSTTRSELYSAQTFYSRGTYGERTDVLAIYDTENLEPVAEINLPGAKRAQSMPTRTNLVLVVMTVLSMPLTLHPLLRFP